MKFVNFSVGNVYSICIYYVINIICNIRSKIQDNHFPDNNVSYLNNDFLREIKSSTFHSHLILLFIYCSSGHGNYVIYWEGEIYIRRSSTGKGAKQSVIWLEKFILKVLCKYLMTPLFGFNQWKKATGICFAESWVINFTKTDIQLWKI